MELGFDHRELLGKGDDSSSQPKLDWAALRARFAAAHALRHEIGVGAVTAGGSFPAACADVLAAGRDEAKTVNPIVSGNGKAPSGNAAQIAAHPQAGDRG